MQLSKNFNPFAIAFFVWAACHVRLVYKEKGAEAICPSPLTLS